MWNRSPADSDAPTLPDVRAQALRPMSPPPVEYPPSPARYPPSQMARRRSSSAAARTTIKIYQAINLVTDIAEAALLLRVVLIFLAADPTAGFANLVYSLSSPLVAPFQGLFPEVVISQGEVDLAAIIAMVAYALGARILQSLVGLIARW